MSLYSARHDEDMTGFTDPTPEEDEARRTEQIGVLRDRAVDHLERSIVCLALAADCASGVERNVLRGLVHGLRIVRRDVMGAA